ncbi:channel-forming protein ArfA/OmpATb [Mycobacterium sp. 050134]|uniref:channel-forming protein ArfA/OmpATb n=1 Tax=Mycobacterium sp. 050134 TaxID=3096111 RepID=UPI002EDB65F8
MVLEAGLRDADATAESNKVPEFYRRSLGLPWLIAVLVIPLLIAMIGYGALDRTQTVTGPGGPLPTLAPQSGAGGPKLLLAPLSIVRNGNDITISGDFPDNAAKAALIRSLNDALPPETNVIDQIRINPNVVALAFFDAQPVFRDSASIPDFSLTVNADTITLAGTAGSPDQENAIEGDARRTWSNLYVVDQLGVNGAGQPAPQVALPQPPAAAQCADLQSALNAVTGGPITFGNDGFSLTPVDQQILVQVADKLKACPSAHAAINGYTDNSGTEAMNIPLSTQRGQTVADFLIAHGVAANQLIVKGLGSVNPVAPNDTADGRARNRRVELVVS